MEYTITFQEASVYAMKAALKKRAPEVFELISGRAHMPDTDDETGRDYHSMEMGRDLPPNSPFVDKSSSVSKKDGFEVRIRANVARWNPREVSNCSFSARLMDPDGNGVSINAGAHETASVSTARVRLRAGADNNRGALLRLLVNIFENA